MSTGIAFWLYFDPDFFEINRCLDSGGCWNGTGSTCEFDQQSACEARY